MSETTNLSILVDSNLKDEADHVFNSLGMNLNTAITVFLRQAVRQKKIPFEIALNSVNDGRSTKLSDTKASSEQTRQDSIQYVADMLTMEEIEAEIAKERAKRKLRRTGS